MVYEQCTITVMSNGTEESVECRKEKSGAFEYGNRSMVVLDSPSIRQSNMNRPLQIDTRYYSFNEGFEGFCKGYLAEYGFTVL